MNLSIKGLRKTFNNVVALDNIDLDIPLGAAFGVLGRNGAGKTTIIRILLGIYKKDQGEVLYNGKSIFEQDIKIGYLPEERGLYLKNKVSEQLKYFGKLKGLTNAQCEESIKRWLKRFDIEEYYDRKVEQLSKGNKQKIQLICAVLHEPEILILDEPFSGLDPVNVELFKAVFKELLSKDRTIIFSSHRIDDVEEFCEQVVLLNKGKIVECGQIKDIKSKYGKKIIKLTVNNNIEDILKGQKLEFEIVKDEYKIFVDSNYNMGEFIREITKKDILIKNISIEEVSLNKIFIEILS